MKTLLLCLVLLVGLICVAQLYDMNLKLNALQTQVHDVQVGVWRNGDGISSVKDTVEYMGVQICVYAPEPTDSYQKQLAAENHFRCTYQRQ